MSSIFEGFLSTSEMLEVFSERHFVEAMLRFEAALARAQASAGLIPQAAAQAIASACRVERLDVASIMRESTRAGSVAIPFVRNLKDAVGPEAAAYVHFGSTSQDVIDTAMALVTRDALQLIEADVRQAVDALLALAGRHAADPMLARTLMQPASVTSFGLKCAGWAAPLVRSLRRLEAASGNALSVQLGGAVGTLAQMKGTGPRVIALMAADLQLRAPLFGWHTQRDEWVALFDGSDACVTPVLTVAEAAEDAQLQTRDVFVEVDGVRQPAPAPLFSRTPASQPVPARDGSLTPTSRPPFR